MQQISQGIDSLTSQQNNQGIGSLNWKLDSQNNEVTQKNKQPYEKEISRLNDSSFYLKNRVSHRFNFDIQVKQTQSYLIEDISLKVDSLFKKFNLSQLNVDYMNDQLKRLHDRVNQERQKKQQQFHSSIKIEDYKNFITVQQEYLKNKQIFQSINRTEQITQNRQKDKLQEILTISHRVEKLVTNEIQFNQQNQVILEKLFIENHLYANLLSFLKNKNNSLNYEKLFRTLENFETPHNYEMRLLADQFKNIESNMSQLQKCERILRNTVVHLENEMLKQIGHLDLQNLNRKFKEYYLQYLSDFELFQIGQFYPSGILFLLMRIGKVNEAYKLLDPLIQNNPKIAQQFYSFFQLQQQEKINQNDVEEISKSERSDLLLQQCYFLLLDISDAFDVFEQNKFIKDPNLYIWLVLKTTHSSDEFVDYERGYTESFKNFFHWNLNDLHETIPQKSVSFKMNIILQRYDYILDELYKQNNSCLAQVEYFILDLIITTLDIKSQENLSFTRQKQWIVENLVNLTQNKHPLVACLILSVYCYDLEQVANLLQKGNHVTKVLTDKTVKDNLETIFGLVELKKIQIEMVKIFFRNNLHNAIKELQQQLEKSITLNQINECQIKIQLKLQEMLTYIKQLLKLQDDKIEIALYLYHETQFLQIISLVLINQYSAQKLGTFLDKRQFTLRSQDELLSLMKNKANNQEHISYLYRFQLIEIFQKAYLSQKQDQIILNEINQILQNIKIKELTKSLIQDQQVDLIKMVFWQILQLIDLKKNQDRAFIHSKVQELNETLLKFPERQGIQICEKDIEFSQIAVDLLNTYSRNLKMY